MAILRSWQYWGHGNIGGKAKLRSWQNLGHGNIEVMAILGSRHYWGRGTIASIVIQLVLRLERAELAGGPNIALTPILPRTKDIIIVEVKPKRQIR